MLLNNRYNKTFIYAITISTIVHMILGIVLYELITRKNKDVHINNHTKSIDTTVIPVDTITPKILKKQQSQESSSTQRIKVMDAQHLSKEHTITPKILKKQQSQESSSTQRIKVMDAQHLSKEHTITPKILKKQQSPKNMKTNVYQKNHNVYNQTSHHDHDQLKYLINTLIKGQSSIQDDKKSQFDVKNIYKNKNDDIHIKNNEINIYKNMISDAIRCKFYNASSYIGKQCNLHIKLNPDGKLLFITAVSGDPILCQAAIIAAKSANFPKPPSIYIYEIFKNITLNFTPQ